MTVYDRAAQRAHEALTKYGQPVVITTKSASAYDPNTRKPTVSSVTNNTVGFVIEWGGENYPNNGVGTIEETLIKVGDKKLMYSSKDSVTGATLGEPSVGDTVAIGSKTYSVQQPIKPLNPAGTVVLYTCNIRG